MAFKHKWKLSVDWLEITYHASNAVIKDFNTIRLGRTKYFGESKEIALTRALSQYYSNEYEITCMDVDEDGEVIYKQVGRLMFGSFNPFSQGIYIRFHNEVFYSWIMHCLHYIEEILKLKFYQIRKLDLCIDFNFNMPKYLKQVYRDLEFEVIVNRRKASNDTVHGVWHDAWNTSRSRPYAKSNIHVSGRSLSSSGNTKESGKRGQNGSDRSFKTYSKEEEIKISKKYYISEEIGFKPKSRIEVSCRNHKSLQTTLKKLDITDMMLYNNLTNEDFLVPIFNHLLFRLIHFRKNRKPYTWLELAINKFESNYE